MEELFSLGITTQEGTYVNILTGGGLTKIANMSSLHINKYTNKDGRRGSTSSHCAELKLSGARVCAVAIGQSGLRIETPPMHSSTQSQAGLGCQS